MTAILVNRLNQILEKITDDDFLRGKGLGNEIAFFIFDYPAEEELQVRQHIQFLIEHIPRRKPKLKLAHINHLQFPNRVSRRGRRTRRCSFLLNATEQRSIARSAQGLA